MEKNKDIKIYDKKIHKLLWRNQICPQYKSTYWQTNDIGTMK